MIENVATGMLGVAVLAALWLAVQLAWRRHATEPGGDPDALAGRIGCHGCGEADACRERKELS